MRPTRLRPSWLAYISKSLERRAAQCTFVAGIGSKVVVVALVLASHNSTRPGISRGLRYCGLLMPHLRDWISCALTNGSALRCNVLRQPYLRLSILNPSLSDCGMIRGSKKTIKNNGADTGIRKSITVGNLANRCLKLRKAVQECPNASENIQSTNLHLHYTYGARAKSTNSLSH